LSADEVVPRRQVYDVFSQYYFEPSTPDRCEGRKGGCAASGSKPNRALAPVTAWELLLSEDDAVHGRFAPNSSRFLVPGQSAGVRRLKSSYWIDRPLLISHVALAAMIA
jgi:hypothetical protein